MTKLMQNVQQGRLKKCLPMKKKNDRNKNKNKNKFNKQVQRIKKIKLYWEIQFLKIGLQAEKVSRIRKEKNKHLQQN